MPTPNMQLIKPTLGGDDGTWDDKINEALDLVDGHDHSNGKGVRITPSGLNINADLTYGGKAAINLGAAQFTPVTSASMAGKNRGLFVNSADNELYFRNNAGTNIQFTTGNTLNISLLGGIGGDYTAVGALFSFDDGTDRYLAQQQGSPRPWAGMAMGQLDLYEQAASIVNRVRVKSPAALAASYTLTLLAALPGSTQILQVSSAGIVTASNTVANAVSLSSTLDVAGIATFPGTIGGATTFTGAHTLNTTLHLIGAATFDSTLSVAGLATLTGGATCGVNTNLTLSGTGYVKRGNAGRSVPLIATTSLVTVGAVTATPGQPGGQVQPSTTAYFPLEGIYDLERLQSLKIKNNATTANATLDLLLANDTLRTFASVLAAPVTMVAGAVGYLTLTPTAPAVNSGPVFWLKITTIAGGTVDFVSVILTTDVP